MKYIYLAFGFMLNLIYEIISNYGVAIILLTVLIKIIVLPLTLKQQKSMIKMQQIQPKLKEIQEKYKNDKEKSAQETMKLYKEYGASPLGGCLPLLIQFPIIIAFYQVIQKPVQYVMGESAKEVTKLLAQYGISKTSGGAQIALAKKMGTLNFDFLGIDLAQVPWSEVKLFLANKTGIMVAVAAVIIPVLAGVTTYLTSKVSTSINQPKKNKEEKKETKPQRVLSPDQKKTGDNTGESMSKSMTYMMPFMTLFLSFSFPAALGLYWAVSNVLSILQTVLLNGYYSKKLAKEIEVKDKIREEKIQERMKKYNMKKKKRG